MTASRPSAILQNLQHATAAPRHPLDQTQIPRHCDWWRRREPDILYEGLPVKGFFAFYIIAASNVVVRTDRSFGLAGLLDGIDLLRRERAPGASTYIRQLHDGLPQSCMHDPNDGRDGFTLFTGVMKGANRRLDFPSPRLRGRSARSLIDMSVQVSVRPHCS